MFAVARLAEACPFLSFAASVPDPHRGIAMLRGGAKLI